MMVRCAMALVCLGLLVAATEASAAKAKLAPGTQQSVAGAETGPLPRSGCRLRGFLVNDFGKDGPTRDAMALLDKDVARWMTANGVTKYKTGPKTVSCEKYLDFGFFDEWTCTAQARICW